MANTLTLKVMDNLSKRNMRNTPNADSVTRHLSEREESMLIQEIREPVRKSSSSDTADAACRQERNLVQGARVISLDDLGNLRR